MDVTTATTGQLQAAAMRAGWEPRQIRQQADELESGTSELSTVLRGNGALAITVKSMRAKADRIEEDGQQAEEELDRRAKALPRITRGRIC